MVFELDRGARIVIRPIRTGDKDRLVNGLRRLSEESIRKRFLAAKPRFTTSELRYLTEVDGVNHITLVAVLEDDPDQLVAVARCVRLPDRPDTAEMAIWSAIHGRARASAASSPGSSETPRWPSASAASPPPCSATTRPPGI